MGEGNNAETQTQGCISYYITHLPSQHSSHNKKLRPFTMSITFAWPIFITQRPPRKADILFDTAYFTTSDFEDFTSQNHSLLWTSKPTDPTNMQNPDVVEMLQKKEQNPRYIHPTFPPATFLTTLIQQECFKEYIASEFPSLNLHPPLLASIMNHKPLRKGINTTTADSFLHTVTSTTL